MADERVWLRHGEHGGAFHCPADAVAEWADMGWVPGDPPEEDNPVVAEMLAAQRAAQEAAAAAETAEKPAPKSRRGSGTDTTSQE